MTYVKKLLLIEETTPNSSGSFPPIFNQHSESYEITSITSLAKANKYLQAESFDLILLDHLFFRNNNVNLKELTQQAPVLLVSSVGNEKDAMDMVLQGIEDFVIKDQEGNLSPPLPVTMEKILARQRATSSYNPDRRPVTFQRLVAGIAHDLSNVLSPILSFSKMLLDETEKSNPSFELLEDIHLSAVRAKHMVRQLSIFRERELIEFSEINLGDVLRNLQKVLQSTLSNNITLDGQFNTPLPPVLGDIALIEQAVIHLCLYVQEAIHHTGKLTLTILQTNNIQNSQKKQRSHSEPYLLLKLTGTQVENDENEKAHSVPLKQSKYRKQGIVNADLPGLELVYSIINQHRATLCIEETEKEITIDLYFPASGELLPQNPAEAPNSTLKKHDELILLVESDVLLQNLITYVLTQKGYKVITAANEEDAYELVCCDGEEIRLILADTAIVEPENNQICTALAELNRAPSVLFMAKKNYPESIIAKYISDREQIIYKPFSLDTLSKRIGKLLNCDHKPRS